MWAPRSLVAVTGLLLSTLLLPAAGGSLGRPHLDQFQRPLTNESVTSSRAVGDLMGDQQAAYGSVGVNEMPVWTVPAGQALVRVSVAAGCNDFTADTGAAVPIPAAASTTGTGDSPLVIDQPSTQTDWELWRAVRRDGAWSACWGGRLNTATSDGVFPSPFGMSASGISYLATVITEADVKSGSIDHAIALDLPGCTRPEIPPAVRNDCGADPGQPPYGTWFRFPAALPVPRGLTPFGRMVFEAVRTYGMVLVDQAGAVMLQAEDTRDWVAEGRTGTDPITVSWDGEQEYQVVAALPWRQLEVIDRP